MKRLLFIFDVTLIAVILLSFDTTSAESLFRASATYQSSGQQYTPNSLFSQPRPRNVGDVVTISIQDTANMQYSGYVQLDKSSNYTDTRANVINNVLQSYGAPAWLKLPSFDGAKNGNNVDLQQSNNKQRTLTDTISCQVVQVLPNGYLVVQGKKRVAMNKEQEDIFVSGIVNPFYIDRNNTIASGQVSNFSVTVNGSGVMSRQQNDGIINKVIQFFN